MTMTEQQWRDIPIADKTDSDYFAYIKSRCVITASGCWEWTGHKARAPQLPYGLTSYRRKPMPVHRLMFMVAKGPIPPKMHVLHECDNAPCCNPDHLWLGTQLENMRDRNRKGRNPETNQTHCKRGHPFSGDNLYRAPGRPNKRACAACQLGHNRIKHGWPEHLAFTLPAGPLGYRPPEVRAAIQD